MTPSVSPVPDDGLTPDQRSARPVHQRRHFVTTDGRTVPFAELEKGMKLLRLLEPDGTVIEDYPHGAVVTEPPHENEHGAMSCSIVVGVQLDPDAAMRLRAL